MKQIKIKSFNQNHYLVFYFITSILLYLNIWLIEFIFLVPLLLYINSSNKINLKLIILIIGTTSLINFSYFYPYGIKFIILIIFLNLIVYLIFIYSTKYIIKNKYSMFIIPNFFFLTIFILKYTDVNNFWINISSFLNYYPLSLQYLGSEINSYLIILINIIIFNLVILKNKNKIKINKIILIILVINFFLFNTYFFGNEIKENTNTIKIAGIQSNLKQNWEERKINKLKNYNFYINQSKISIMKYKPEIIIWPEYVFTHKLEFDFKLLNKLNSFSKDNNITLILGSIKLQNISSNKSKRYNSLYVFNGKSKYQIYNAYEPVTIFDKNVAKMKKNNSKIKLNTNTIGTILCYEENFQYIFRKQILENNASLFIIDGNQYFVANSHGQKLTSLITNLRAFENNIYLFRLETSGLSTIINNNGENIIEKPNNKLEILYYEIPLITKKTIYTKYGDKIEIIFLIIILILTLNEILNTNKLK